ncbi:MAG: hypothetical protein QOF58_1964 [Pseudonocardiales bacterium]|nr:hypothetical protein [Pseudonocardiales bacterium]
MNAPERSIGPLLAALCVRLAEENSPLAREPLHAKVLAIIAAVRRGDDDLGALFDELDTAMRQAGFPRGLEPVKVRAEPGKYGRLPGLDVHAVHARLLCPGDCPRVERSTPRTRLEPPLCQVHDRRMRVERRR